MFGIFVIKLFGKRAMKNRTDWNNFPIGFKLLNRVLKNELLLILFLVSLGVYSNHTLKNKNFIQDPPDEFTTLAKYLEKNVNFLKGDFPIMEAEEIKKKLNNEASHVIDIRSVSWF